MPKDGDPDSLMRSKGDKRSPNKEVEISNYKATSTIRTLKVASRNYKKMPCQP